MNDGLLVFRDQFVNILAARAAMLCVLLTFGLGASTAHPQNAPAAPQSLSEYLHRSNPPHIFYIHGIGSDGPGDYDSWALRKTICKVVRDCISPDGTAIGQWDYADRDEFDVDAPAPALTYLGEPVWKNQEEWRAAAPYVVHFKLQRKAGPTIYVDELNWFPIVFSLKCRQIVKADAYLVGPSTNRNQALDRIRTCSTLQKSNVPDRYVSYDWIPTGEAPGLRALPSRGALVNRDLKNGLMDWRFSDAVLSLGPLRTYILDGLRQLILKSVAQAPPAADLDFAIVSHSLGSYLIFAALDSQDEVQTATVQKSGDAFNQVLAHTGLVYFFANQLRLLAMANLDSASATNLTSHLERWGDLRCAYLQAQPAAPAQCNLPHIIALNDASDLLTWTVPDNFRNVKVTNYTVKNATRWFWIIESPTKAHDNYAQRIRAIENLLTSKEP